LKNAQI
jgi:hypothetical protein